MVLSQHPFRTQQAEQKDQDRVVIPQAEGLHLRAVARLQLPGQVADNRIGLRKTAGLAATQVGIHLRLAVMDVIGESKQKICMINPEVTLTSDLQIDHHGCLSVPNVPGDQLKRAAKVHLRALDRFGKPFELDAEGTLAICIQHEMDHMEGRLYIDHLSSLKRERLFKKAEKYNRRAD